MWLKLIRAEEAITTCVRNLSPIEDFNEAKYKRYRQVATAVTQGHSRSLDRPFEQAPRLKAFPTVRRVSTMEAVIHLTDPGPEHWRRARSRASLLNEPGADVERVTLLAELDAATFVVDGADATEEVEALLEAGIRVTTNRTCLENRDIPVDAAIDGVEILESSTLELIRLQDAGAGLIKIP